MPRAKGFLLLCAFVASLAAQEQAPPAKAVPNAFSRKELGFSEPRLAATLAVRETLAYSPQILLQGTNIQLRDGAIFIAQSDFDTHLTNVAGATLSRTERDLAPHGTASPPPTVANPVVQRNKLWNWEVGLRKKLRNGIVVQPTVGYHRSETSDAGKYQNRGEFGFEFAVLVPLAKGSGSFSNQAPEISARIDFNASLYALRQVTSQSVFSTMAAYWECRGAEERYKLLCQTEEIAARLVSLTEALVKAGQIGSSQLAQILADQNSTVAQRITSEQSLVFARQQLALAMGVNPSAMSHAPLAVDPFPEPNAGMEFPDLHELTATGLALRDDLRAARLLIESRKVLVEASRLNLRPTVNLQLDARYAPFKDRATTLDQNGGIWTGTVGLSVDWPVDNNLARGQLIQDSAVYDRSRIDADDLSRNIVSNIISTHTILRGSAAQVLLMKEAAAQHAEALAAQEELFSHGQANLTDVITARQRMISSQLEYVNDLQTYATNIIRLRLECGLLLPWNEVSTWVTPELWTNLPFVKNR